MNELFSIIFIYHLFYIPKTYNMDYKNHYSQFGLKHTQEEGWLLYCLMSKELIEKGMYYARNSEAKEYLQLCINEWIERGIW